jgi:hypothetical protein
MSKLTTSLLLVGGGGLTLGAAWFAARRSSNTAQATADAVAKGGSFKVRATGYWPFTARSDERRMEGGVFDRMMPPGYKNKPDSQQYKDHLLHTLEDHLAGKAPFVSVSGDPAIFPYGQRLTIDAWPNAVFRVVDTGSHFMGATKIYRVMGTEPLDICVQSSSTVVPKLVIATIVPGDNFEKGKLVATAKFKDQTVVTGIAEGRTNDDREALARAVESELGGRPDDELRAAAWSMRNRADDLGVSVYAMLAPNGLYGSSQKSGGYASTRRAATEKSRQIAGTVLDAVNADDSTGGAIDFWVPAQQQKMRALGDVYRATASSGDATKAKQYERYADYGTENDVRAQQAKDGLCVLRVVGVVELLGRA